MNPRVILEALVRRLEPIVGGLTSNDVAGAWENEEEALQALVAEGKGHLFEALVMAREALASGDEAEMNEAALICPTFVRTGEEIAAKTLRRRGGNIKAAGVRERWKPWIAEFQDLRLKGKSVADARHIVHDRMEKAGWTVKERQIRDRLK